jgi:hypothetical protein
MYPTLQGTIRHGRIEIAENVPLPENATVLVTILETSKSLTTDWQAELDAMHARLRASGPKSPKPEEVARYLHDEHVS